MIKTTKQRVTEITIKLINKELELSEGRELSREQTDMLNAIREVLLNIETSLCFATETFLENYNSLLDRIEYKIDGLAIKR